MNVRGLAHLFVVYIVWGSTYLGIRLAVRDGSFPPFVMAGTRLLVAGSILLLMCRLRGNPMRPTPNDWFVFAASGLLLWFGGNGIVTWAEQRVDSGYTAIVVGSLPLWMITLESFLDRRRPTWRLVAAVLIGMAGIVTLNYPVLRHGTRAEFLPAILLVVAVMSWGSGMVLQKRRPVSLSAEANSGYQLLFGAVALLLASLAFREPRPTPTPTALAAWGYLIIFGSVIAFTSFVKALQALPANVVSTYAYVNPVIAVILGAIIAHEPITQWTVAGSALTLLGVAGVYHERQIRKRQR